MADIEQEFLCSLCSGNKAEQDHVLKSGIGTSAFIGFDAEAQYVWAYYDKYQKFPSVSALRRQYSEFRAIRTQEPLRYYADKLVERNKFRALQKLMSEAQKHLRSKSMSGTSDALHELAKAAELISGGYSTDIPWTDFSLLANFMERNSSQNIVESPYVTMNRMIRGFRAKNLITIAGRPAMCKTWLMIMFALSFWSQGLKVLFIEKEMTSEEIYERMDALFLHMPWIKYLEGTMQLSEVKRYNRLRKRKLVGKPGFVVSDSEDLEANGLDSVMAKIIEHDPDAVFIDGAYLLDEAAGRSFTEKATMLSRATKRLAKNRSVLLVQSLQMNRQAEEEAAGLGHIAWADAYGQDSDYVMYIKGEKGADTRIVEMLKARTIVSGGIGEFIINAHFDPYLNFEEITSASVKHVKVSTIEG